MLVDVVVATALITLAVAALGECFVTSLRASDYARDSVIASYLAEQKIEQLKSAALSSELSESAEMIALDQQKFERHTHFSAHPIYSDLLIATVTVSWQLQSQTRQVSYSTYVFNGSRALHP